MNPSWVEPSWAREPSDLKDPLLEPPSMPPSSPDAENLGAAYLRSLKDGEHTDTVSPPTETIAQGTPAAGGTTSSISSWGGQERRRSTRYKCNGSAEFRLANTDIRTWGTLTDVSLHGCYVEMMQTSPTGTLVDLVLKANGIRIEVKGEVRVSYPFLGMGIIFTEITQEEQHHLQQLLESFSQAAHAPVLAQESPGNAPSETLPVIVDATAVLSSILKFFQTRSVLTRRDFTDLIRKTQS